MTCNRAVALLMSLALISCTIAPRADGRSAPRAPSQWKAMEFELKDQYNSSYTYRFPKEKVSVLAFADRNGVSQVEGWIRPLYERYTDRIDIHGVAVVSSVPSMFRGLLRNIFKSRIKFPVMLDWEGKVTKGFGYSGGRANLFVIDRNGNIVLKLIGPATAEGLEQVSAQINSLLGA